MERLAWVCLGSALGGGARHLITEASLRWLGAGFPYGTLAANLLGCLLAGLLVQLVIQTSWISPSARLFLLPGVMGGLTTYSAFNSETLLLAGERGVSLAAANLALTFAGCLGAGLLGMLLGRLLAGD